MYEILEVAGVEHFVSALIEDGKGDFVLPSPLLHDSVCFLHVAGKRLTIEIIGGTALYFHKDHPNWVKDGCALACERPAGLRYYFKVVGEIPCPSKASRTAS